MPALMSNPAAFVFDSSVVHRDVHSSGKVSGAVTKLAYVTGTTLVGTDGRSVSYSRVDRVVATGTELPAGAPAELADFQMFATALDTQGDKELTKILSKNPEAANRPQVCRSEFVSLRRGLTLAEEISCAQKYARRRAAEGLVVVWAIHHDPAGNNPHVHYVLSMSPIKPHATWDAAHPEKIWGPRNVQREKCRNGAGEERYMTSSERTAASTEEVTWEPICKWTQGRDGDAIREMTKSEAANLNDTLPEGEHRWIRKRGNDGKPLKPVRCPRPWNRTCQQRYLDGVGPKEIMKQWRQEAFEDVWTVGTEQLQVHLDDSLALERERVLSDDQNLMIVVDRARTEARAEGRDETAAVEDALVSARPDLARTTVASGSPLSYRERGVDRIPTVHVGHGPMAAARRAINELIRAANDRIAAAQRAVTAVAGAVTSGADAVRRAVATGVARGFARRAAERADAAAAARRARASVQARTDAETVRSMGHGDPWDWRRWRLRRDGHGEAGIELTVPSDGSMHARWIDGSLGDTTMWTPAERRTASEQRKRWGRVYIDPADGIAPASLDQARAMAIEDGIERPEPTRLDVTQAEIDSWRGDDVLDVIGPTRT